MGYDFDGGEANPEWVKAVEKMAENKNVWCKISGLYQRSQQQPAPKEIGFYRPVLDVLWKNLGAERLVFGSNWPCTKATGDYESFVRVMKAYFAEKGQEASERDDHSGNQRVGVRPLLSWYKLNHLVGRARLARGPTSNR